MSYFESLLEQLETIEPEIMGVLTFYMSFTSSARKALWRETCHMSERATEAKIALLI
jgi:hypothetical protein